MCKISVIIPVYNVEGILKECLDTVVNQTLKDIEIICINDGSTDGSLNILENYAKNDPRIKIINNKNSGPSISRNLGLKEAKGEFISFVDSDDWIDLDFLEKLYNAAIESGADIAAGSVFREKYILKYKKKTIAKKTGDKYKLAKIPNCCYIWNKIYNRKKLQNCKLEFEENVLFEDVEWSHKILHYLGKMVTVPNTCYHYRINPFSIVNLQSDRHYADFKNAMKKSVKFIENHKIKINVLKKYQWDKKVTFKLLGLPLFTTKQTGSSKGFYLFGFLPLFEAIGIDRNV